MYMSSQNSFRVLLHEKIDIRLQLFVQEKQIFHTVVVDLLNIKIRPWAL